MTQPRLTQPIALAIDWRSKSECFPFEDENNYYITVESEYETPGDAKESRLAEAQRDGVFKLLKFYGKDTTGVFEEQGGIFDASNVEDYYVSYRPCVRMRVLVSVPKGDFDSIADDPSACAINKPAEGYLSAFIPVGQALSLITTVADNMMELVPTLLNSENYISNVNIIREINRLSAAGRVIQRYIDLNNIPSFEIEDPECVQPNEVDYQLEIGFSYDYNAVFALVGTDQYTIGYDCLLESSVLNHDTTINYLINIREMLSDLQFRNEPSFNVFDFFTKYTIPVPIILPKENNLDGIEKYNEDGNLFSFANLAKLITLDLDVNLCKTDEEKTQEDSIIFDPRTKANIAKTVRKTKEFVGNNKLSTTGVQELRETLQNASIRSENEGALNALYEDIMAKVNFGCVLEETIQCILENLITTFGQEVFDDPDLAQVVNVQNFSLGGFNNNCSFDRCDGSFDVNLIAGFPIFQGVNIPDTLPTLDFLAETMDNALTGLYNTLVSSLSSLILGILNGLCELILSFPDGIAALGEGFKSWLSQTLGIDLESINDPNTWKSVLLSESGGGFLGVIGKAASGVQDAVMDAYTETGISVNLPNPQTGQIEEKFISPEFIATFFSELNSAVDDVDTILTPSESQSIFKGNARPEVLNLAYKCVTRNGSTIFTSPESFQDTMSSIGEVLQPQFLTQNILGEPEVASDYCDLTDDLEIRQEILRGKDSTLSTEQIDEIINKEKERKKNALLQKVDELNSYQAGNLAPSFPNIFGKGGLIPETPPVISEISNIVVDGALGGAVANFSIDAQNYSDIWGQLFGVDAETETVENVAEPRRLFSDFVGDYSYKYGTETGKYKYGYSQSIADAAADPDVDPVPEFDILNGNKTYIFQSFSGNFKKDSFRQQLTNEFFDGVSNDATEAILDFIEDKDEENGTWQQLFFDPTNPLISYAAIVYHEGGLTNLGADRLTEVILVKNEFDEVDQPVTEEISYDYGNYFGTSDKENFKTKITNTSWEGPLGEGGDFSNQLADGLVSIANNDWKLIEKTSPGYVVGATTLSSGAAAGTAATAVLYAAPALKAAADAAFIAGPSAVGAPTAGVKILSALSAAVGPVGWAIAAAIIIGTITYLFLKDGEDIAQRIIIPEAIGGFVYSYDIVVSDRNNKVTVVERKISDSLISRGSLKSPGWPSDIVTVNKITSVAGDTSTFTQNSVSEYIQDYTIGNTSTNLGLELTTQNLTRLSYPYVNETTNLFDSIIGEDENYIPASSKALAYLVNKSVVESFGTTDTNIRKELVETSANGPAVQQLINNILFQMIERIRDPDPNKYWLGGYQNGNFDNINLSYPASDILNYNSMRSFSQQLNSQLLNATFSGEFCDSLSTTRRVNASQSVVMLIRLLIVEQAMTTIQVFDKFDLAFMESDIFITNIQTLLFNETIKYRDSFGLTTSLYSDLTAAAKKYYEILAFLGEQEPVEFETDTEYLKDIIRIEVNNLRSPIVNALNLGQNWKSWDGFVTNRLFPTFDAPSDIDSDYQSSFVTPPESQQVSNSKEIEVTSNSPQVTEEDISDFVKSTKTSFKQSLGDSIPDAIYTELFNTFNEWVSTLSLPSFDNYSYDPSSTWGTALFEQISDTISSEVGVANYSVNFIFEADSRFGRVDPEYNTYSDAHILFNITATFDGDITDDFEASFSSEAFLDPFFVEGTDTERFESANVGGFAFEKYVDYKIKTQSNVVTGYEAFLFDLLGDSNLNSLLFDKFEYIRFGYRMVYVADVSYDVKLENATSQAMSTGLANSILNLPNSEDVRNQQKAFYVTEQTRTVNGTSDTYDMVTFPIVSAECEYVDTTTNQDITIQQFLDSIEQKYNDEIFNNIKNMLLETDEYKIVIDNVLCLKELIASLSFYEYASLSDESVFLSGVNGVNLHNITSRAKLSTLQTFYASIYGEGQISYQDPFTKNVIT